MNQCSVVDVFGAGCARAGKAIAGGLLCVLLGVSGAAAQSFQDACTCHPSAPGGDFTRTIMSALEGQALALAAISLNGADAERALRKIGRSFAKIGVQAYKMQSAYRTGWTVPEADDRFTQKGIKLRAKILKLAEGLDSLLDDAAPLLDTGDQTALAETLNSLGGDVGLMCSAACPKPKLCGDVASPNCGAQGACISGKSCVQSLAKPWGCFCYAVEP